MFAPAFCLFVTVGSPVNLFVRSHQRAKYIPRGIYGMFLEIGKVEWVSTNRPSTLYLELLRMEKSRVPSGWVVSARTNDYADIRQAKQQSKLGLIFGFQRTNMLGDQLTRIELFRNLGVRILQLSYNDRSLYTDACLEPANAGLSFLGRQAVAEMNSLLPPPSRSAA
jgi:microsomal dipeptidase-like Zn-dependent dipeptidase